MLTSKHINKIFFIYYFIYTFKVHTFASIMTIYREYILII